MKTYIALLRGVNISGKNIIKMADLKKLFEDLDCKNVNTYLQTGNIVFQTKLQDFETIIYDTIKKQLGLTISIKVYEVSKFKKMISQCPFELNSTTYLTFLFINRPEIDAHAILLSKAQSDESFSIFDDILYLSCPSGYGKTELHTKFIEKAFETIATTRNGNTSKKLLEIAESL